MTKKEIPQFLMLLFSVMSLAAAFLGAEPRLASGLNVFMKTSLALVYLAALLGLFNLYRNAPRRQDVLFAASFVILALGASLSAMGFIR